MSHPLPRPTRPTSPSPPPATLGALLLTHLLAQTEGILPALERARAVAEAVRRGRRLSRRNVLLVNLSGRGDKDLDSVAAFDRAAGEAVR